MFKIWMITKGFSRIVAQDVFEALVQLLLSGFNFHTLSQGSLRGRELTPFQMLQAGKQRHIKTEARQPGTPWLHSSSLQVEILPTLPFSLIPWFPHKGNLS